jgi:cell division transport system permease protein
MAIKYLFREGFKNIIRNKSSFVLSAGVSAACLLLFTIFLILTINIVRVKGYFEERIEIFAFLAEDANKQDLIDKIQQLNGVRQVNFVSKQDALAELKNDLGEDAQLLDILERNPLPASLRIQLDPNYKLSSKLTELEEKIRILKGIRETWSGQDLLIKLQKIMRTVIGFDIAIVLIVFLAIIFIVSRTVEATVIAKAREIEIMRLVGASSNMVKLPFYVEGFFHGLFGSVVAFIVTMIIFYFAARQFPILYLPFLLMFILTLIIGCALGLGGSYIALSRVLKEE